MKNVLFNEWLNSPKVSDELKHQMNNMNEAEINLSFKEDRLIFGTAGVRAKMGPGCQNMNEFVYQQMTAGFGNFLLQTYENSKIRIIIGHDNRRNSHLFTEACAAVLTSLGIEVILFKNDELIPTPIISFLIRKISAQGAINITASHNPKEDNGFKVYDESGSQILPHVAELIIKSMPLARDLLNFDYKMNNKLLIYVDSERIQEYFTAARSSLVDQQLINVKKDFPIIFTGHHGTTSKLLPEFLNKLNFTNVIKVEEQCQVDENFTHSPISNPEDQSSFKMSIEYAEKYKSDIAIASDPDGDRMAVAILKNNEWHYLTGNQMGILYTYYVLKNKQFSKPPYLISSYVSNNLVDRIANSYNASVIRTGTGFKWMGDQINKNFGKLDFVVAFEEAIGALNSTINRDKDAFQASALALEIYWKYRQKNMDLIDVLNEEIFPKYGFWFGKTDSYKIINSDWKILVDQKIEILKDFKQAKICSLEIVNIQWNKIGDCLEWTLKNDNWIKFRKSGTEPKFKIYYNLYDKSSQILNEKYQEIKIFLEKYLEI